LCDAKRTARARLGCYTLRDLRWCFDDPGHDDRGEVGETLTNASVDWYKC